MASRLSLWPRLIAATGALFLVGLCLASDPAKLAGGRFFSDGATYYSMGWSLVADFDFEYTATDLLRVKREYPQGPSGIFLKRAEGGYVFDSSAPFVKPVPSDQKKLYFGKAMTYPILAAPFVALFGTRGFLVLNAICLIVAWSCAFVVVRERSGEGRGFLAATALILASVAPVYVFWIQPELMNLAVVSLALLACARNRPLLSAVLFGIAGYTKPTHLLMAAPLGLAPFFESGAPAFARLVEAVRRGAVMVGCTAALFGANMLVTGEWNYQGGERKTFGHEYPFDRGETKDITFGNSGEWMTTMKLGPLEEGEKEALGTGIVQSAVELQSMFRANVVDFWAGRYAGMFPYFATAFIGLLAFLLTGPRDKEGWFAVTGLLIFYIVSIRILPGPSNWYGGGGTLGNRYFMAALPLAVYFLPRRREIPITAIGTVLATVFLFPAWLHPVQHSVKPSLLTSPANGPFTYLRAELAMLNDLSFCTDAWRKKQPYDDVEGDAPIHRSGSRHGYWLYFPDDGTFGREAIPGMTLADGEPMEGYRVKRGLGTEALLRANEPVDWIDVTLFGGRSADEIEIRAGGEAQRAVVPAAGSVTLRIHPGSPVMYYDSFVYSVRARSMSMAASAGGSEKSDHALIRLALHVSPRS
jgi:hypothetical protein